MGNHNSRTYANQSSQVEIPPSVVYKGPLGEHGRFFKTSLGMHDQGVPVTVKTYVKTDDDVSVYEDALLLVESKLSQGSDGVGDGPRMHVWSNQEIIHDRGDAVHIVRQYFWSSLAQRITGRPFLTWSEKAWIGYQIILGVVEAHACGVCHGDIKTENIMLTSWGWVFLVDFLPFKPTWLPKDNPADFSIFFDTSGKRKCCIAPERFSLGKETGERLGEGLRPEMDVFSLGCVLAELFSDGASIFKYADVLEFARSAQFPEGFFQSIDSRVATLIGNMLERDPGNRPAAKDCVELYIQCEGMVGEDFDRLHSLCNGWCSLSPDERIRRAIASFPPREEPVDPIQELTQCFVAEEDGDKVVKERQQYVDIADIDSLGKKIIHEITVMLKNGLEGDVVKEYVLESPDQSPPAQCRVAKDEIINSHDRLDASEHSMLFDNLTVIFCALLRSCRHFSSKMKLLHHMQDCIGATRHKEILLHVVIPHVITAATEAHGRSRTKAYALSLVPKLVSLLDGGGMTPSSASHIVGDYILPSISLLPHDSDLAVQCQYACSIGAIGVESSSIIYYQGVDSIDTRDEYLARIRGIIERGVHDILVGTSPLPKLALLPHLGEISYGVGCKGSIEDLLPALLTLFNSREWNVRSSLYTSLESIFPVLGPKALQFILPFIDRLLTDPEIGSLLAAIALLTQLIEARLFSTKDVVQINQKVLEIRQDLLQLHVIRDHIKGLYRASRNVLGPATSKAMLHSIYTSETWTRACMVPEQTHAPRKMHIVHAGHDTPFHAEFIADTLEVYTISTKTSHEMENELLSRSNLERIIDTSCGDEKKVEHDPRILLQSPSLRKGVYVKTYKDKKHSQTPKDWMPKGTMVARIPCHSKPITQISGNLFEGSTLFATSSKDGMCKLWDTRKIEKDISFHPRASFIGGSGYNSICECFPGAFLAGREDGVLDAWDIRNDSEVIAAWNCGPSGILDINYLKQRNICITCTGAHGVLGIDTRSKDPSWTLHADPPNGIPTRIGVDNDCQHYFVTGSSRGYMTVWDLRFLMPVHSWRTPAHAPIEAVALIPGSRLGVMSMGPVAVIASGIDEVSGWDIVSGSCKIVLASRGLTRDDSSFIPEALRTSVMDTQKPVEDPLGLARQMGAADLRSITSKRTSVKAILVTPTGQVLSGGTDKCIRLWNPRDPPKSYMIACSRDGNSSYSSHTFSSTYVRDTRVILEHTVNAALPECSSIWHSGSVSSLMQLHGQRDSLLASASSDGILHVWK